MRQFNAPHATFTVFYPRAFERFGIGSPVECGLPVHPGSDKIEMTVMVIASTILHQSFIVVFDKDFVGRDLDSAGPSLGPRPWTRNKRSFRSFPGSFSRSPVYCGF
jgi:hypothetical protein